MDLVWLGVIASLGRDWLLDWGNAEGLAVALALIREGHPPLRSFGYAILTGLVEPIGGLLGVSVVTIAHALLPWGLAFAGGAMLFVISSEIIPETHRHGHPLEATFGLSLDSS